MNIANLSPVKHKTVSAILIMSLFMPVAVVAKTISSPLTAVFLTQEQLVIPTLSCSSFVGGVTSGTGISSLLGGTSLQANDCITPIQNYFSFTGSMILTVSSGDELFADYSGSLVPTSYPTIFLLEKSTFSITGGTGNFLHASGGGKLIGGENIQTGLGLMYATGTLSDYTKGKNSPKLLQTNSFVSSSLDSSESQVTTIASLDNGFHPNGLTLGQYFFQDQSPQVLAENPLPESASLSLLGIGLISLAVIRRRKISNSIRRNL